MDDAIIFARTPVGTAVARDSNTALPRAMRTLLLSVDGRTRVASYRMILSHLGDVGLLFEGLENAGYIARTDGFSTRVAAPAPTPVPRTNTVEQDLRALSALTTLQNTTQLTGGEFPPPKNYDVLAKIQEAQTHFTQFPPLAVQQVKNGVSSGNDARRAASLNAAKSAITDFLMQNMPDVAMEISLSIDRIDSIDELERSLNDYSQLIAKLGRASVEHLRHIKTLIQRQ